MYDNLRKVCIQNVKRRYLKPEGNKKIEIGYEFQAKKFPCYKDIQKLWHFDFVDEERKRFTRKGGKYQPPDLMWDCTKLTEEQVNVYLQSTFDLMNKRSGMTEEVALRYLVDKDYNVIQALYDMQQNP